MKLVKPKAKTQSGAGYTKAINGNKLVIKPKAGESASKNLTVGRSSTLVKNGIYVPVPTTSAVAPVAVAKKKSSFKSPSSRSTGMKHAMKKGGKGPKCK